MKPTLLTSIVSITWILNFGFSDLNVLQASPVEEESCPADDGLKDNNYEIYFELENLNSAIFSESGDVFQKLNKMNRSSAACSEWKVYCLGRDKIDELCPGAGAFCDPAGQELEPCSIVLTPSMCRALGIAPNPDPTKPSRTLTPGDIDDLQDDILNPTPAPNNPINCKVEIVGICIAAEELDHAEKINDGLTRSCEIEVPGKEASRECFKHYWNLYCDKPRPDLPQEQCDAVKGWKDFQDLGISLNQCVCSYSQGQDACAQCNAACKTQCQGQGYDTSKCNAQCDSLTQGYCHRVNEQAPPTPPFIKPIDREGVLLNGLGITINAD